MAGFPLYIEIKQKKAVIVGGGEIALRKARVLAEFEADITIISPEFKHGLKEMENRGQLHCHQGMINCGQLWMLDTAFMVICATNDRQVNHEIACYCRERKIWVDCADSREDSSFWFPSVVKRDEMVIGVSSSGGVPALTRHLRRKIEQAVPKWYGELEQSLRIQRDILKQSDLNHEEKRRKLREMIEEAERRHGK